MVAENGSDNNYQEAEVTEGTERCGTEDIRHEQERLKLAREAADLGIWEWVVDRDELIWDERTIELIGFSPDAGVEKFLEVVHSEDREDVQDAINRTLDTGEDNHIRFRVSQNETMVWIEAYWRYIAGSNQDPDCLLGTVQDVTEIMGSREALRKSREKYQIMFDNVQDALFLMDVVHTREALTFPYIQFNSVIEEKAGINSQEMAGRTPEELFDQETAEKLNRNYRRCVEQRETIRYTEELDLPKGSGVWQTKLTPLIEDGMVEGILGATRDVGEEITTKRDLKLFRQAMQKNPDEIYIIDAEAGRILDVTESVSNMLGYSREELINKEFSDVNPEIGTEIPWQERVRNIKLNGPVTFETIHFRKDGRTFPVETHANYIELDGEQPVIVATTRDLTERKAREEKLEQEKKRFQTLFEEAPIGLWKEDWSGVKQYLEQLNIFDATDLRLFLEAHPEAVREAIGKVNVLLINRAVVEMTRGGSKQRLKEQFPRLLLEESYECIREDLLALWKGADFHDSTMKIQDFNGDVRYILRNIQIVPGHEKDWSQVFVSYRDITRQKEVERALRENELHYRTLFDQANEAFLMESVDDEILDVNQTACELLGYSREELIGMSLREITPPEILEELGGKGIVRSRLQKYGTAPFNSYYFHKDSSHIAVESTQKPIRFKGQEAVMACVRDRSELEQVRRESETGVTHDLRTPLNSITGTGTLLMNMEITDQQRSYLRTILNAARNMERLTNDILDIDRIERGELKLDRQHFTLSSVLGEVVSLYGEEIEERDIMLSTEVGEPVPERLIGDPNRLRQILHNLVDNAVRHTRDGTIKISVNLREDNSNGVQLGFIISDTGVGIPPSKNGDIFQKHKQVRGKGGEESDQGLGLGLSICQELVQLMDGEISVESGEGEGTDFTFTVQLQEGEESSFVNLEELEVLLMDFELPEFNGIEAIREIRREESARNLSSVPIIAQTAMAMTHIEKEFMEAGAERFLRKPINKLNFYRAIRDVFQAKQEMKQL